MSSGWQARHTLAMFQPDRREEPLVRLVYAIAEAAERFGEDGVLREGVAQLLEGTLVLLNASWGERLEMGRIDTQLRDIAQRIGYNLDRGEWIRHD